MTDGPQESVLLLERSLDEWAKQSMASAAREVVSDLSMVLRAAGHVMRAIDELRQPGVDARTQGRALYDLQTWLFEQLFPSAEQLRTPLTTVIGEIYAVVPEDDEDG